MAMQFKFLSSHERGATTLLIAAVILPLLFFLFSLSLDAGRYLAENQKVQKVLDDATNYAYQFLPFQEEARRAAEAFLSRYEEVSPLTQVLVDSDAVTLLYAGSSVLTFPRFFGIDVGVPMTAQSRVRGTPFDTFIALDASSYLGPELYSAAAWGDALQWPAGDFFEHEYSVADAGVALDSRVVTQQCFNPAFSALKRAAIQSYEYLSAFRLNAIGVGVFPGNGGYLNILRPVVSANSRVVGPGEVDFDLYVDRHNRNELCAAAAEHELQHAEYQFPLSNSRLGTEGGLGAPVNLTLPDSGQGSWYLNSDYLPYLQARHTLWAESRREQQVGDTAEIFREIRANVVGASFNGNRGGLVNSAVKSAYLFAGDVPHAGGGRFPEPAVRQALAAQFAALRNDISLSNSQLIFKFTYILLRHEGNDYDGFFDRVR